MRTFVGFGFGPIQAGLFLAEAQSLGNFRRLVVAEVQADVVDGSARRNGALHWSTSDTPTTSKAADGRAVEI
jgi:hypothetical protein